MPRPESAIVAQQDGLPQERQAPTTCWVPGEVVRDTYRIAVPVDAPAGTYRLITGLYRYETGERLAVRGPDTFPDQAAKLVEIAWPVEER